MTDANHGQEPPDNVHHLHLYKEPEEVDIDKLLESAKGKGLVQLLVLGELPCGHLLLISSHLRGDALLLLEKARHMIVHESNAP